MNRVAYIKIMLWCYVRLEWDTIVKTIGGLINEDIFITLSKIFIQRYYELNAKRDIV